MCQVGYFDELCAHILLSVRQNDDKEIEKMIETSLAGFYDVFENAPSVSLVSSLHDVLGVCTQVCDSGNVSPLSVESLQCIIMVLNPLFTSSSQLLLCEAIDACGVLYHLVMWHIHRREMRDESEIYSLLQELECIRKSIDEGCTRQSTAVQMRRIAFLTNVALLVCPNDSFDNSKDPTSKAFFQQVAESCIIGLFDTLLHFSAITVETYCVSQIEVIVRARVRLLPTTVPKILNLSKTIVSANLESTIQTRSVRRLLKVIISIPSASPFHSAAKCSVDVLGDLDEFQIAMFSQVPCAANQECLTIHSVVPRRTPFDDDTGGDDFATQIQSSVGILSMSELTDLVIESLRAISVQSESIKALHFGGLKEMLHAAAKNAQRAELERNRLQELLSIENVSTGHLILRTKGGALAFAHSKQFLEKSSSKSQFLKNAFFSVLKSFNHLNSGGVAEHIIRQSQVLVSRSLALLPEAIADVTHDALLDMFRDELQIGTKSDVFELVMQTLFMKYANMAPIAGLGHDSHGFKGSNGPSESSVLRTSASAPSIDPENPISWIFETSNSNRKRERDDGSAPEFSFHGDGVDQPSSYGHFTTRVMQLVVEAKRNDLFINVLLQCPAITHFMWHFLQEDICVGENSALGVLALTRIVKCRRSFSVEALSSLLHLTTVPKLEPRRQAIYQIGTLIHDEMLDRGTEELVIRFAKKFVTRIPLLLANLNSEDSAGKERELLMTALLDRHLSLYLKMCSIPRHSKHLKILLDTFVDCDDKSGKLSPLQDLLLSFQQIPKLIHVLFNSTSGGLGNLFFVQDVMPILRKYPKGSEPLIHRMLSAITVVLRKVIADAELRRDSSELNSVKHLVSILIGHCRTLFNDSLLTLPDGTTTKDVRFMIPVLSMVPRTDLKITYLVCLMRLSLRPEDDQYVVDALKEVLLPSGVSDWGDGLERAMKRTDLLVFLHQAHQNQVEGITTKVFKTMLSKLFKITRSFDSLTTQMLYTPNTIGEALKDLLSIRPVPSQTLYTAMIAARKNPDEHDLHKFIIDQVLAPLAKDQTWDKDKILWKGVIYFVEEFWDTDGAPEFLSSLPDRVLMQALREHPVLHAAFKQKVGANSSFAHVLGAV